MDNAPDISDQLLVRLRAAEQDALAELFDLYRERLWRMVNFRMDGRLRGRVDPDDVLQEAYVDALKRLKHFGTNTKLTPFGWLRAIVHQTLLDVHRRHIEAAMRNPGKEVAIDQCYSTTSTALVVQLAGHLPSPSGVAMRGEALSQLEQAIGAMDPLDREVLALRHFEELSNSEVAEVLRIQVKAASIRYIRALQRLKAILVQMAAFSGDTRHG